MLCVGKECQSAIMVRQTATYGAVILRLRRDDKWIEEMMFWLDRFKIQYVDKGKEPPKNFFCDDDDENICNRYNSFVKLTKELSDKAELVDYVKQNCVQRAVGKQGMISQLFLD